MIYKKGARESIPGATRGEGDRGGRDALHLPTPALTDAGAVLCG
ncbi:MAG TPA: hypothetical protein VF043_12980 [Ktedonobacteraceae bacterium]